MTLGEQDALLAVRTHYPLLERKRLERIDRT